MIRAITIIQSSLGLALLLNIASAQNFQRTYASSGGNEAGSCIHMTNDGNFIISGTSSAFSNGYPDIFLSKADHDGNLLWSKAYGTTHEDKAYYSNVCSDGGFIITGYQVLPQGANQTWDLFLIKTDSVGNLKWSKSYGGSSKDFGWYVTETPDSGYMVVGSSQSFGAGDWNGYAIKTDSLGVLQWSKSVGGTNFDNFHGMSPTQDGGYIITGTTSSNSFGSSDIWLVRLKGDGDTLWTRQYGKSTEDAGNAVIETKDGGYMVAGDIHVNFGAADHNSCLMKVDSLGTLQWVKTYGSSPGSEIAWDVVQTDDQGYILGGSSGAFGKGGGGDMTMIKTDSLGNPVWSTAYGSSAFDDFWLFETTADKGMMLLGSTSKGGNNMMMIRTDSLGYVSCDTTQIDPIVNIPVLQVRGGTVVKDTGTTYSVVMTEMAAGFTVLDLCEPTAVAQEKDGTFSVLIYPNPARGHVNLVVEGLVFQDEEKLFALYDVFGREVLQRILFDNTSQIDLSELPSGVYLYRVIVGTAQPVSGRVVVQE